MANAPVSLSSCFAMSTKHALSLVFGSASSAEQLLPQSNRTNSMGHAESDCHTCQERKRHCDRQRPRCGICAAHGNPCGGFGQEFRWQGAIASMGKGKRLRSTTATPTVVDLASHARSPVRHNPTTFTFVQQSGVKRRRLSTLQHDFIGARKIDQHDRRPRSRSVETSSIAKISTLQPAKPRQVES